MTGQLAEQIKANLNLYAVLQNLEELVQLDSEMSAKTKNWNITIQFSVKDGPEAYVAFRDGKCTFGRGKHASPNVKLYFRSPQHLNAKFNGKANPIPLKGFMKLGFMSREFAALTHRLTYYLKPEEVQNPDDNYKRINTILTLQTAVYAAGELAVLEPESKHLAASMGTGVMGVEVLPDGPYMQVSLANGGIAITKTKAEMPKALLTFRNLEVTEKVLNDELDGFRGIVQGDMTLRGTIPMMDNFNIIMARVQQYLS